MTNEFAPDMREEDLCPNCEKGALVAISYVHGMEFRGSRLLVENFGAMECSNCHLKSMTTEQIRANQKLVANAKKAIIERIRGEESLLSGDDIRRIREKLGLTQIGAAEIFGGGPTAFSKYERNEVVQSRTIDRFLRLAEMCPEIVRTLKCISAQCSSLVSPPSVQAFNYVLGGPITSSSPTAPMTDWSSRIVASKTADIKKVYSLH